MPTIIHHDGLRIMIHTNDHAPAHVHAVKAGNRAVFDLHCPDGPAEVQRVSGFNQREVRSINDLLNENLAELCEQWRVFHGDF